MYVFIRSRIQNKNEFYFQFLTGITTPNTLDINTKCNMMYTAPQPNTFDSVKLYMYYMCLRTF